MESVDTFDVVILGGGPAGVAAAVYAARKKLKTALITKEFGGQSIVSETIYNWIGTPEISGASLAKSLEDHVRYYDDVSVTTDTVSGITLERNRYTTTTVGGQSIVSKTMLYALGSGRRQLDVPGAAAFEHKGLTYCASCDGPVFAGQDVVVVGGGNAGFESALQLLAYCSSVTLLNRSDFFRADPITVKAAESHPNFKSVTNVTILEVTGDKFVNGIRYGTPLDGEVSRSFENTSTRGRQRVPILFQRRYF
jgi:NADH-dependent peroxiredoxin subunit F